MLHNKTEQMLFLQSSNVHVSFLYIHIFNYKD